MTDGDALRRLADVVDALEETPLSIQRAHVIESNGDEIVGQLTVGVPVDGDLEVDPDLEDPIDESEPVQEDEDEAKDDPGEYACDVDGCDFTSESERGLAIHQGRSHKDDEEDETDEDESDTGNDPFLAARERRRGRDESDPSTEDDTEESGSETEARDVDLEEADADDSPAGTGEDVDGEDVEAEEITVDGVDELDEDDEVEIDLPDGFTKADIDELTLEVDTLGEVAERLGVPVDRARTITFHLGVYSRVRETWRNLERGER